MKLSDVPYDLDFYWKGERYVQCIKAKKPNSGATCYKKNSPSGPFWDMPAGRIVKPVIRGDIK